MAGANDHRAAAHVLGSGATWPLGTATGALLNIGSSRPAKPQRAVQQSTAIQAPGEADRSVKSPGVPVNAVSFCRIVPVGSQVRRVVCENAAVLCDEEQVAHCLPLRAL